MNGGERQSFASPGRAGQPRGSRDDDDIEGARPPVAITLRPTGRVAASSSRSGGSPSASAVGSAAAG